MFKRFLLLFVEELLDVLPIYTCKIEERNERR